MSDQRNQKILDLLSAAVTSAMETDDIETIEELHQEIAAFIKLKYEALKAHREQLYIAAIGDSNAAEINGWLVEYKPQARFTLDSKKLASWCKEQDIDLKDEFYSTTFTKPRLTFKAIK
jgi:hypothetical protein